MEPLGANKIFRKREPVSKQRKSLAWHVINEVLFLKNATINVYGGKGSFLNLEKSRKFNFDLSNKRMERFQFLGKISMREQTVWKGACETFKRRLTVQKIKEEV